MLELPDSVALAAVSSFMVSKGALIFLPVLISLPWQPTPEGRAEQGQSPSGPGYYSWIVFPLFCSHGLLETHINPRYNAVDWYNQQGEIFSTE